MLSAILMFMASCHKIETAAPVKETFDLTATEKGNIAELFSNVDIVPLQFQGTDYPSVASDIIVTDKYIFVNDKDAHLHVFNSDGSYVASSNSCYGMGPGEYSVAMGWTWNPFADKIEILTPNAIMFYDVKFNFMGSCELPTEIGGDGLMFDRIFDESATIHYLLPTGVSENPCRILQFNSATGKITGEMTYADNVLAHISMQYQCFFKMPNGQTLFAPPAVTYGIFAINGDELTKEIALMPGNKWISKEYVKGLSGEKLARHLMTSTDFIPLKTLVSPSHIFIMAKQGMQLGDLSYFVIDRDNGKIKSFKLYADGAYRFPPIESIDAEYAYAILDKESLVASPHLLLDKASSADSILNRIEDESLLLLKYHVK